MNARSAMLAALFLFALACGSEQPVAPPPLGTGGFPDPGGGPPGDCDEDRDGHDSAACSGDDCDDGDPSVFPGAAESCNGADDDCDGTSDEGCDCQAGDMEACWEGDATKRGIGACRDGFRRCLPSGTWGPCTDAATPSGEATGCDGIDSDCDGQADADPACRGCAAGAPELCGNGLDDDCNGAIDDADLCTVSCAAVNSRGDPGALACCLRSTPAPTSFACVEHEGLRACAERECLDLDGDLDTRCSKLCDASGCFCGRRTAGGDLTAAVDCGFLSPCARVDCDGREDQPCYSGPPRTLGVGPCHGGRHSCLDSGDGLAWSACTGEQVPVAELCGNGVDDDCDGLADEADGATGRSCPVTATCPEGAAELCGNGLDDDCDGFSDEACPAPPGATQFCWTGAAASRSTGTCKDGRQSAIDGFWGPCRGEVLPGPEVCDDALDTDCDRLGGPGDPEEPACCVPGPEVCNGMDDDCDGVADEGLVDSCGQCPGSGSCYGLALDDLTRCDVPGRTCTQVEPHPGDRGLIVLAPGPRRGGGEVVYAVENGATWSAPSSLLQVDAGTGDERWSVQMTSGGYLMNVTAATDGSVWLFASMYPDARIEHRSGVDGALLCQAQIATVASLAADPEGGVWVGTTAAGKYVLRRYGNEVALDEEGTPHCVPVDLNPDAASTDLPTSPTGTLVLDPAHRMWNLSYGSSVLDLLGGTEKRLDPGLYAYGPAVLGRDGAIYVTSPLRRVDTGGALSGAKLDDFVRTYEGLDRVLDLAPAPDGTLFALESNYWTENNVLLIDPIAGTKLWTWPLPEGGSSFASTGLAVDGAGRVWTGQGRQLERLDPSTGTWDVFPRAGTVQIAPGSTDVRAADLKRGRGHWSQVVDPGAFDVRWGTMTWRSLAPTGTRIAVAVRFADDLAGLDGQAAVCGPYSSPPVDLSNCSRGRRYARVEIDLAGFGRPMAGDVALTWDRP